MLLAKDSVDGFNLVLLCFALFDAILMLFVLVSLFFFFFSFFLMF